MIRARVCLIIIACIIIITGFFIIMRSNQAEEIIEPGNLDYIETVGIQTTDNSGFIDSAQNSEEQRTDLVIGIMNNDQAVIKKLISEEFNFSEPLLIT